MHVFRDRVHVCTLSIAHERGLLAKPVVTLFGGKNI
jgi:hypothetical protein